MCLSAVCSSTLRHRYGKRSATCDTGINMAAFYSYHSSQVISITNMVSAICHRGTSDGDGGNPRGLYRHMASIMYHRMLPVRGARKPMGEKGSMVSLTGPAETSVRMIGKPIVKERPAQGRYFGRMLDHSPAWQTAENEKG